MSETGLKIFKLNFDGSFDEISYENIKDVFTIVNILAIYLSQKKTMYIWIGRNATQALKNHISNIRVLLKEEFPTFRIIRNFTFEMRDEPFEFFNNLNIAKEELYEIIDYQEKVMLPTLKEIDSFKSQLEKFIESEDFTNAIKISEEIIKLAKKIEDDAVLTEQNRLIVEIKSKYEDKVIIDEISEKASTLYKEFTRLIEEKEYLKAHQLIEEFELEFRDKYDLSLIPIVKELLSKEKKIWKEEQDRLTKLLNKLETDLYLALKNLDIEKAESLIEKGKFLFSNLLNDEIKLKWGGFETEIHTAKQKVDLIGVCDSFLKSYAELRENFQFKSIYTEINNLLKKVQDLDIPDYKKKLENARKEINSAEESYKKKLLEIAELEKIIKSNQNNNLIDDTLRDCQNILKLIKSIKKSDLEEYYTTILNETEEAIEKRRIFKEKQENLKKELTQLNKEINDSLKKMDVEKAGDIIVKSKIFLAELVDNKVKENWNKLEKHYNLAKELIQNVETLSNDGILALESKSYNDCLKKYEEIVSLLQGYNKHIQGRGRS
ncbi:MAG: hypothetical protein ACFFFT_15990 [Candidatus Thorarchaeota archaeon]